MGHWSNTVNSQVEQDFNQEEEARAKGKAVETKIWKIDQVFPLDKNVENYIRFKLPERKIPTGAEFDKLKQIREKAFDQYVIGIRRKAKVLSDARKNYAQDVANKNGIMEHQLVTVSDRTDFQHIPYMEKDETLNQYLADYFGKESTAANKRRMLLQNMKEMVQKAKNNPLLDIDQSDDTLAEHYSEILSLAGPSIQEGKDIADLIKALQNENPPAITAEEANEYTGLKKDVENVFRAFSVLTTRFNSILSPMYPYIGSSTISYLEGAALAKIDNLPKEFLDEDGTAQTIYQEFDTDFTLSYDNDLEDRFKKQHKELFNAPVMIFSPDLGNTSGAAMLKSATVYLNEKKEENGKLVPGKWRKFIRGFDGTLNEENVSPEENTRMQTYYVAAKDEGNQNFFEDINDSGTAILFPDGTNINRSLADDYGRKYLILNGINFYYFQKKENDELEYHYVTLDQKGKLSDKTLSPEDQQKQKNIWIKGWLKGSGLANLTNVESRILEAEKTSLIQGNGHAHLNAEAAAMREQLRNHTRILHSNVIYNNVEQALEDYQEFSSQLSTEENLFMLGRISQLANLYLSGRHASERMDAMRDVAEKLSRCAAGLKKLQNHGLIAKKPVGKLRSTEALLRTLRRSMRNQDFDVDTFAFWTALKAGKTRPDGVAEIRNSEAIRLMAEHVKGTFKDERQLNAIYDTVRRNLRTVRNLSRLSDSAFIAAYNAIHAYSNKDLKTGIPALDEALRKRMMPMMYREAMRRNLDIVPGKRALTGPDHHAFSYSKRDRMILTLPESEQGDIAILDINMARTQQRAREVFANDVCEINYDMLAQSMPEGFRDRSMPFVVTTCLLMDAGLTLPEILDGQGGIDKKRSLGRQIMEALEKAKDGSPEEKQALRDLIARSLAEHAEDLLECGPELGNDLSVNAKENLTIFVERAGILRDGIFDAFSQSVMKSDMWNQKNQDHSYQVFHRNDESLEDTKARIEDLNGRINSIHADNTMSLQTIQAKSTLLNYMRSDAGSFDKKYFSKACINVLAKEKLIPFIQSMNDRSTLENTILSGNACSFIDSLESPLTKLMSNCPLQVRFALAMDPALQTKFKLVPNEDYIKELPGNTLEEKQANLLTDLTANFKDFGQFILEDNAGNKLKVSPAMLQGKVNAQEKAFMNRFNNEILDYCAQKEQTAYDQLHTSINKAIIELPDSLKDCKELYKAAPDSMTEITRKIREHCIVNSTKIGRTFSSIVIGDKNGQALFFTELKRRGINPKDITASQKYMLFASICAAALKKGLNVSMIEANKEALITDLNMETSVHELRIPENLTNAAAGPLSEVWKGAGRYVNDRATVEDSIEEHRNIVNQTRDKVVTTMNKVYMEQHPDLAEINTVEINKIAAAEKKANDVLNALITKYKIPNTGYVFGDKTMISPGTAIMAVAYGWENKMFGLDAPERFTFNGSEEEIQHHKDRLDEAAGYLSALVKLQKTNPKKADGSVRFLLSEAMQAMGKSAAPEGIPDMGEYVSKYVADLKARRELTNIVMKSKAPADIGLTRAERKRTMKDLQKGTIILDSDLAAEEYLTAFEKTNNIFNGKDVKKNLMELQQSAGRQKFLMEKLSAKPKALTFKEAESSLKEAWEDGYLISRKSVANLKKTKEYTSLLRPVLKTVNQVLKAGKSAVEKQRQQALGERKLSGVSLNK